MTGWGAVKDCAKGIAVGQDLEMPGGSGRGIACAVGVAYLAGNAGHMAGLVPKAVEYAVCTQGDKDQPDAVLCQLCRAVFAVGGAGEQRLLLSAVHQQRLIGF